MTPKEYLDRYTYLKFPSPFDLMQNQAGVSNYGSGWDSRMGTCQPASKIQQEYHNFVRALRVVHHGNANTPCGERFSFKGACQISPREEFSVNSLLNTFVGKGSPDEITDTLRLGMLIGRFGMARDAAGQPAAAATAQAYAKSYITLDCNGLVGNYYGGNPQTSIDAYASTSQRRTKIGDVRPGDVVVTHCETFPFEHVGLIQDWTVSDDTAAIRVVEWGWYGGEEAHYAKSTTQRIKQGPDKRFGIGWSIASPKDGKTPTFRYVFAPPATARDPRGWP